MYHTLKILLFLPLVILCGCSALNPGTEFEKKMYETDKVKIEVQIPKFKNFSDDEFEEKLNNEYKENLSDIIDDFFKQSDSVNGEKCTFKLKQTLKYDTMNFLSIMGEGELFTGGVHGNSFRITKNIDTQKNIELILSELFSDENWKDILDKKLCEIEEKNPEQFYDLWKRPQIYDEKNFYLSNNGLVIFFPPYELSYYARGFVEFLIPYSDIAGELKDEYKTLIK